MPDQAFRALFNETEKIRWDSMNQVRKRARRRTIAQTTAMAGIVALALVSGGVAVAQVRQDPVTPPVTTPSPSPSQSLSPAPSLSPSPSTSSVPSPPPSVTPSGITAAMMLQPQDVGSGYTAAAGSEGDWTFEFNASVLGCPRGTRPDAVSERGRTLRKGKPQDENFVLQHTARYAAGSAAQYLDEIRDRVASCSPYRDAQSVRIAAEGFAGDESLLVIFKHEGGSVARNVLVRKGDVLTQIYTKPTRSDSASRELGRKAAARL
jgi:hypothetical protein